MKPINSVTRPFAHKETNIARTVGEGGCNGLETDLAHLVHEKGQNVGRQTGPVILKLLNDEATVIVIVKQHDRI